MSKIKTVPLFEALETYKISGIDRNLFSAPDWLKVIHKTYGLKLFFKYIEKDGQMSSYIIYSVVKNFLEWKICICSYCDYFDCYVESPEHWHSFYESLREEYPQYRIAIRNLRDTTVRQCPDFKVLSHEYVHVMDLREDIKSIEQKLYPGFKRACRKAVDQGVTVKRCGRKELYKFYQLHLLLRKQKYRLFAQPLRFFENIWDQYVPRDKGFLLGAYDKTGKFIAGNIYLICGHTLFYKFGTSALDSLEMRPNNLLFLEGIKLAKEKNLQYFDLGSSGCHQEGLIRFKTHMYEKTEQLDITHLGFQPADYKFSQKRILNFITRFCTHRWMPNFMTEFGSKIIYPYLG